MTHKERFYATLRRQPVDRPACWLGVPVPEALPGLFEHFGVDNFGALKARLGDDIYAVDVPYHSPVGDAIYAAFDFAKDPTCGRTLTAPGIFEDATDPACVDDFDWPNPAQYIDPAECRRAVAAVPEDYATLGLVWSAHFQDACAAFGMESALMKMVMEPAVFRAVIDRITEFYLQANEIFYAATRGRLNAVLIGNDFGSQRGLMLSPQLIRDHVLPGTRRLVEQAKAHGLAVIHHSCGSIHDIINDLIDVGVDAIHPIQALAANMDAERLHEDFGGRVSFCGGVDVQDLMVHGTPESVAAEVRRLIALFPTGLILSPAHEALLPDVKPANVRAMFETTTQHQG